MLLENMWGSVVKFTRDIRNKVVLEYPDIDLQVHDFEANANEAELPNSDLIGPTALTMVEVQPQLIEVTFAIGVTTYVNDKNLFRLRTILSRVFEEMRPEKKFVLYKAGTLDPQGFLVFTDGTMMAPMSRAETRPWQYVQASALLDPKASYS